MYVNEIGSNPDVLKATEDYLKGAGYLFLGERINERDDGAADFVWIGGKAYAFSSILEKIEKDENKIKVRPILDKTKPLDKKKQFLDEVNGFYSDEFIKKSAEAGKTAIAGTTFTI